PVLSEYTAPLVCRSTTSTPGIGVPAESLTVPEIAPTDCADADHAAVDSSSTGTQRRTHESNAVVRGHDENMIPPLARLTSEATPLPVLGKRRARDSFGMRAAGRDRQSLGAGSPAQVTLRQCYAFSSAP